MASMTLSREMFQKDTNKFVRMQLMSLEILHEYIHKLDRQC